MVTNDTTAAVTTTTTGVKTDEKKQHFDDIYVCDTPVPYKLRILDELSYVSDDFNRQMFEAHIAPVFNSEATQEDGSTPVPLWLTWKKGSRVVMKYVDLCSCFGNTTMACLHQMTYEDIRTNWSDTTRCQNIDKPRRDFEFVDPEDERGCTYPMDIQTTGIDISPQALAYGKSVGLYDTTIHCDLNDRTSDTFRAAKQAMAEANIVISTASLVYLDLETIKELIEAFATGDPKSEQGGTGMLLVNFLNPFALEKADQTKRLLLDKLEFVASRATRHRKMSQLERTNYPDDGDWSLLELWVLRRRTSHYPVFNAETEKDPQKKRKTDAN